MAKTTISLPDEMLDDIDRRAAEASTTRSGLIQEAVTRYIAELDEEKARLERAERIGAAMAGMREVAQHMPPGTDGTAIIRRFRDRAEPWLPPHEGAGA